MAQSNVSLSYPNRVGECTLTQTIANWLSTLPLSNIKNPVLKKVARTVSGVNAVGNEISVTFGLVLPKRREIGCVAIANHNFTTNAKVRIQGFYNSNFTNTAIQISNGKTAQFDSGLNYFAYPRLFAPESGKYPFTDPNWWYGTIESDRLREYTPLATFYPDKNYEIMSLLITITDTNNLDNYLEFGRVFLGRTLEPKNNPEYGDISQGYVDLSETTRAKSCTKYHFVRPKMRTLSCVLKHLDKDEAFGGFYDAQREVGLTGEMLYAFSKPEYKGSVNGDGGINMTTDKSFYQRSFLCNFSDLSPVDMPYVNGYATALKLEEIV